MIPPNVRSWRQLAVRATGMVEYVMLTINDLNPCQLSVDLNNDVASDLAAVCRTALNEEEAEWMRDHCRFYVYAENDDSWSVNIGQLTLTLTFNQLRRFAEELETAVQENTMATAE